MTKLRVSRRGLSAVIVSAAAAACFAGPPRVERPQFDPSVGGSPTEALRSWDVINVGDGTWDVATNWDPVGVPALGDDIRLYQSDAANRVVTYSSPGGTVLNSLRTDASGNGLMTMSQSMHVLTTNEFVQGVFNGKGRYNLSGGTLNTSLHYIGAIGTGTFNMTGGRLTNGGFVSIGNNVGATGRMFMSGGTYIGAELDVGYFGSGTMVHTGGNIALSQFYGVGFVAGGTGFYRMDGTASLLSPAGYVGLYGSGTFVQDEGTHTLLNTLSLGEVAGATGTYIQRGGTIASPEFTIGKEGTGTFLMEGGAVNVTDMFIGAEPSSTGFGKLYIAPSVITVANEFIVGSGTNSLGQFVQEVGAVNVAGDMSLGYEANSFGRYTQHGGSVSSNKLKVGYIGNAQYNQYGDTHTVNTYISIADQAASTGEYNMRDGVLNVGELEVGYRGAGSMYHDGGTVNVSSFTAVGFVLSGRGHYQLLPGGTLNSPDTYVGLYGTGTFTQTGGLHNVPGVLSVGENTGAAGTYTLGQIGQVNQGRIITGELDVGFQTTGVFYQNGGTITANELNVGASVGGVGSFTLSDGTINVGDVNISYMTTSSGQMKQTGGTHNVTRVLNVAVLAGTDGSYTLDAGNLNAGSVNIGGGSLAAGGLGVFTQNGGVMQVANRLRVYGGNTLTVNNGSLSVGTLFTNGGGQVIFGAGGNTAARARAITGVSGKINLNDNALIVDYTGTSPLGTPLTFASVANLIANGWNNGAWNGLGIYSGLANDTVYGIGYIEASQKFGISGSGTATFRGETVDATSILILYTYYGDTNLDRAVDLSDFATLGANFNFANRLWKDGDFNYSGAVNLADFALLAVNWNRSFPTGSRPAPVPEPVSGALLAAAAMLARRRR
ncbi:MAG: hypothetical protein NZ561_01295 [Phycisphaerae bacterium]|nr:hypothetical protein [Phycisphaerae bacterium]MDW8261858.1 hypothetical protein [Phycisphaerales bacterium]